MKLPHTRNRPSVFRGCSIGQHDRDSLSVLRHVRMHKTTRLWTRCKRYFSGSGRVVEVLTHGLCRHLFALGEIEERLCLVG